MITEQSEEQRYALNASDQAKLSVHFDLETNTCIERVFFLCYNPVMLERKTELGDIRFSRSVIERIVEDAADDCGGKVMLQNFRGKYMPAVPGREILFEETPEGVAITVYIVVSFGTSIKKCTGHMMEYISSNIEKVMGEKPYNVKIVVTGVQSVETAKRHIEITEQPE